MIVYFLFFLTIVLPVVLWVLFLRGSDLSEPEPGKLMRKCFYSGFFVVILAGVLELVIFSLAGLPTNLLGQVTQLDWRILSFGAIIIGIVEEVVKYAVLRATVFYSHDFNQIFDGIVYGITVALGFSIAENILYFLEFSEYSTGNFIFAALFRALFSTLLHVMTAGIMGYYLGKAKFSLNNKKMYIVTGLVSAILIHAIFDFVIFSSVTIVTLCTFIALIGAFGVFTRLWTHPEVRMIWRFDLQQGK